LIFPRYELGDDFVAYGLPEDAAGPNASTPVPRVFRGYYQRFVHYQSPLGYEYLAAELNIACPAGLSGGPLFRREGFILVGMATENLQVSTTLDSLEEVESGGSVRREVSRRVVEYGIGLMLRDVEPWLQEYCGWGELQPSPDSDTAGL
jgi:hypothetical protein